MDEFNGAIKKVIEERNRRGIPEFEGYSPEDMSWILYYLFDAGCPVRIKQLRTQDFELIPIFNGVKFLLTCLSLSNEIKLTAKGFLPTRVVADLYNEKYFPDEMIEKGYSKLYKETDALFVRLSRILLELTGAAKKMKGSLTLTAKGKKFLNDDQLLLEEILKVYCTRFNWAYFDGYESENIGRLGCGFSIILLHKYGNEIRDDQFYAEKYFAAYPMLMAAIIPTYGTVERYVSNCFRHRMIDQFGLLTGIISEVTQGKFGEAKQIRKTDLLDRLFEIN